MPTHAETRHLPYTAQQMYDLVADVARYPEFLPWTTDAIIRSTQPDGKSLIMIADLVVSFKVFSERFTSRVVLDPKAKTIQTEYLDGPFNHMISNWAFIDKPEGGCLVSFNVDFEFKSRLLQRTATFFFNSVMERVVHSFEKRADHLYSSSR